MTFGAPWGWSVKVTSALFCFVAGVPTAFQLGHGRWIGVVLAAVVLSTVLFLVRGYTVTPRMLEVHRLGWTTRIPLDGLREVAVRPGVMKGSWRLWGNGGVFAISGWFSNAALGRYRAFVTDTRRTVVLTWPEARVVVSPDDPQRFVSAVEARVR